MTSSSSSSSPVQKKQGGYIIYDTTRLETYIVPKDVIPIEERDDIIGYISNYIYGPEYLLMVWEKEGYKARENVRTIKASAKTEILQFSALMASDF